VLLVNALLLILFLSDTYGGRVHDKRIAAATPYPQGDRILNFQQSQQGAALVDDSRADNEITLKPPIYVVTGD
jgi:hypothetical protein